MSKSKLKPLKILCFDIESAPTAFWAWRTGKQFLSNDQIVDGQKTGLLCIAWKWLGEKEVTCLDWGIKRQNSEAMIEAFSKVIEQADLCIAHNGKNFDLKHINTQRLINDQAPIDWPVMEDTLSAFRKHFYMPSFKLDYLAKLLLGAGKDRMQFKDWIDIVQYKKPAALAKMKKYCKRDVLLLEGVYKKLQPFLKPKIHVGLFNNQHKFSCPRCGDPRSESKGTRTTMAGKYSRRQCKSCAHVFKGPRVLPNN